MRLNQITVSVHDISRAASFYRGLGLRQIVDSPHYARFVCPDGEATFSIHLADVVTSGTTVIYFECDDLEETVSRLKTDGHRFEQEPTDQPWLWREAI